MSDLFLRVLDLFTDPAWDGIALAVVIMVLALGFIANIIDSGTVPYFRIDAFPSGSGDLLGLPDKLR
jgi:hypothetical protein